MTLQTPLLEANVDVEMAPEITNESKSYTTVAHLQHIGSSSASHLAAVVAKKTGVPFSSRLSCRHSSNSTVKR
ncbi:MAG: hypothetical protein QGI29_01455 [Pirellulales bacterium]|nr:hypothetical protein [Pirellulales bacterium]